jgi:lipopolysaccharide biosynthesis protein
MPAAPGGENEKGYWEDLDIVALNIDILNAIGYEWHTSHPITRPDLTRIALRPLEIRAVELLRQKTADIPIFGIKDPRFPRLMPFWKKVFDHLQLEVSYVLCVRHPMSVARSLKQRKRWVFEPRFEAPKSYYLWLDHVVRSVMESDGSRRVVVDYDLLVTQPEVQLRRMAETLELSSGLANVGELEEYKQDFLDASLRHTRFELEDLRLDPDVPSRVIEAYTVLRMLAKDEMSTDSPHVRETFTELDKYLEEITPALRYMTLLDGDVSRLDKAAAERDQEITELHQVATERDGQIGALHTALNERDGEVAELHRAVTERDGQIGALHAALNERDREVAELHQAVTERDGQTGALHAALNERDGQIGALHTALNERDGEVAELHQAVAERDGQIGGLHTALNECEREIADLIRKSAKVTTHLNAVLNSNSWRLASPLRFLRNILLPRRHRSASRSAPRGTDAPARQSAKTQNASTSFPRARLGSTRTGTTAADASVVAGAKRNATNGAAAGVEAPLLPNVHAHGDFVPLLEGKMPRYKPAKLICFYLPQFHPIPENDRWWGKGFTEWKNVKPAKPQFVGHYQPHVPGDLGYYNLLDPGVQKRQVELAKLYGIDGFCFYFYWFGGKRLLETPIENFLNDASLDASFCLCWANENWCRRWDGLDNDILIAQQHSPEDDLAFIQHVARYMRDHRYIRIDGRPLLIVYRPSLLLSPKDTARRWREWCRENGIGEVFLACTQSFEAVDPATYGFDAAIEFPPNNSSPPNITDSVTPLTRKFRCNVYDWQVLVERSREYVKPAYKLFRGVCPAWDNTARRGNTGTIFVNSSPQGYYEWLFNAIGDTRERFSNPDERLVFINAWNEWAEGAHLEPDGRYGYAYLEATREALVRQTELIKRRRLDDRKPIGVAMHIFYMDVFDEILGYLENIRSVSLKLYVTTTPENLGSVRKKLAGQRHDFTLIPVENRGRDILPFLRILPQIVNAGHELLIKIHTKKSSHREDGDLWRRDLLEKLLTDPAIIDSLEFLEYNPGVGILGPTGHIVPMSYYWGSNETRVNALAARMGVDAHRLQSLNFVAGSMFIARVRALMPLLNLGLCEHDFELETGQIDGTLAHAVERLFSASACSANATLDSLQSSTSFHYQFAVATPPSVIETQADIRAGS